jgi:hypothetical protein
MKSSVLFGSGLGALVGSFAFPSVSLPLQAAALGLFVASELAYRYEEKFVQPVQSRRYQAWQATLDHAYEHQTGAAQAHATNQIDWRYRQRGQQLNLVGSVREQYLNLFTQGRPATPSPTIDVDSMPVSPAQPLRPDRPPAPSRPTTAHSSPAGPVSHSPAQAEDAPLLNLSALTNTALLLIYGCPSGGKSTLAKRIATHREAAGHQITVADPHGSQMEWGDWPLLGAGRDYERLNDYLSEYDSGITEDYIAYSNGKRDFSPQTLIADEFTQWADRCSNAPTFIKAACSDIRKIQRCVILISHADTMAGLGNASGMRAAINRAAIKLELEADIDLAFGKYIATGYGWLQYPGKPRAKVKIPYANA